MNFISRAILYSAMIMLVACANQQIENGRTSSLSACKITCLERFDVCHQSCHDNCKECTVAANIDAAKRYRQYKHEQCIQGKIIARELNSYRDPLQCRKITCDCQADYSICLQSCTGIIYKQLRAAPLCG